MNYSNKLYNIVYTLVLCLHYFDSFTNFNHYTKLNEIANYCTIIKKATNQYVQS